MGAYALDNKQLRQGDEESSFAGVTISLYRNGEPNPCGIDPLSGVDIYAAFHKVKKERKSSKKTKYHFDSILTEVIGHNPQPTPTPGGNGYDECGPERPPSNIVGKSNNGKQWGRGLDYSIYEGASPYISFCDMGEEHTVLMPDHDKLVPVVVSKSGGDGKQESLPCHYYTREGFRISSMKDLEKAVLAAKNQKAAEKEEEDGGGQQDCTVGSDGEEICPSTPTTDLKIFAVPAGRVFMFAPTYVGEVFNLHHMKDQYQRDVSLVVLSLVPRVFDVLNFFDPDESNTIVARALAEKSETHRMKRSSTGASGYNVNSQRTSDNGFDTNGATAIAVKRRCMSALGFDEYHESYTDGLQVLRYNKTTAYIPHLDWIDDPMGKETHDYITSKKGTNRFATILLYMSDLDDSDGGETVFTQGWPDQPEKDRISKNDALAALRESGEVDFLKRNSWQETMVANCRSRLSVRPHNARAVLFYSQHPNGEEDQASLHGGCPVLSEVNTKWAANLWAWNGPRVGYPGSPINPKFADEEKNKEKIKTSADGSQQVTFQNMGKNPAFKDVDIYFEDQFWADFTHGSPQVSVNTFDGHTWNIKQKSDKKVLLTW
eukprot:CAMPEP_0198271268 /NCGR_PEP_ID=MMETSP1447-20131203/48553_1 /TAXON_ID=420782 /ORGANISM="Chaetoceros dichaeta, Strain CCMP1751" /LENGTH=601 /DNA_ID=CAMNT_0043963779 /DNA_START=237 /DNA_END=2039 /DNA_ORIENTATION=-